MTKRHLLILWLLLGLFSLGWWGVGQLQASESSVPNTATVSAVTPPAVTFQPEIVVFVRQGCQHCADEEAFLTQLAAQNVQLKVTYRRLENPTDRQAWSDFAERVGTGKVTPLTIIGQELIIGFDAPENAGEKIKAAVAAAQTAQTLTDLNAITAESLKTAKSVSACAEDGSTPCQVGPAPIFIQLPLLGRVDLQAYPLVALSVLLGFVDGFNPCAMWVLVTFMLILLQVGSRQKMMIFAGTFIFAEAIMYYLIMTVWFQTWDFVKLDSIVTPIVGLVAIGSGAFFLREWWKGNKECQVLDIDQRSQTKKKIMKLAEGKFTFMTFIGILLLAFSVNVIEFACSIGIPQTFTKILEINNLSWFHSNGLIALYILFYMVDDLIVFGLALYCADKIMMTANYSKWSHLIGGLVMVALGLLLILQPGWLVF